MLHCLFLQLLLSVSSSPSYLFTSTPRAVVVRQPDGTLRNATWDEKMRMCQTFIPRPGREAFTPRMFHPEFLSHALQNVSASYLLDSACTQFEPDDPDYIRVVTAVYNDVDRKGTYEELHSNRLFGGLVFYLASVVRLDGLILDRLQRGKLADAADIVRLLNILHPKCKCALEVALGNESPTDERLVEMYANTMADRRLMERLKKAAGTATVQKQDEDNVAVAQ